MPKTVEFYGKGIREIYPKKGCHSCYDCLHLHIDKHCMRKHKEISGKFPYDNTKCPDFELNGATITIDKRN